MLSAYPDPADDIVTRATSVRTVVELAELLRGLRRRQARERGGPPLTYEQIAKLTAWSLGSVGNYLAGVALAPTERFDQLALVLGARVNERGALATARDRVDDAQRARRTDQEPTTPAWTLPAAPAAFTGRAGLLARLDELVHVDGPGAVVITAVAGMGGVGKTALALRWARSAAARFPDGQLYVNLRGYDRSSPLSTMDALGVLLSGLRLRPSAIPTDEAGRLACYRDLTRGRHMLVLLDNARSAAQVTALLPAAPGCALITSRDDLRELVTGHHARSVRVDVLTRDEAVALLTRQLGVRAEREPAAVRALAQRCGYLPLALRVVAELAGRQQIPLAELTRRMSAELARDGLDAFDTTGDPYTDVRTVLSWSVNSLPAPAARAYRLLGLHFGFDIDGPGFAVLAGVSPAEADAALAVLRRAHLVETWTADRYTMHDLVRAHARETAEQTLDPAERVAAQVRILDYYRTVAAVAVERRYPGMIPPAGRIPADTAGGPPDPNGSSTWLDVERRNLIAGVRRSAQLGLTGSAARFALVLWPYLNDRHLLDGRTVLADTAALGPDAIDADTHADLHNCLGATAFKLGRLDETAAHARDALAIRGDGADAGAADGRRMSLALLGAVLTAQGRPMHALAHFEAALGTAEPGGASEMFAHFDLGEVHLFLERFDLARQQFTSAIQAARVLDRLPFAARSQRGLAQALAGLGRHAEAVDTATEALAYLTDHGGSAVNEISVRNALGLALCGLGRLEEALDTLAVALRLGRELPTARPTTAVLNTLGETYRACADHTLALESHREAVELAELAGDQWQRARALVGIGDAHAALGEPALARHWWRRALADLAGMGLPSARRVSDRLAADSAAAPTLRH